MQFLSYSDRITTHMPYVETEAYPIPKPPETTQNGWESSGNLIFKIERLINRRGLLPIEKWRELYKKVCKSKGLDDEDNLHRIQGTHTNLALEVQNGNEEADLDFLQQKLSGLKLEDPTTSSFQLYRLAVICFRKPKPGSEKIMELWGRGLFQAAFKRYQYPQFARGAIDEMELKANDKKRARKRERRLTYQGKTKDKKLQLFHRFNNPEVFRAYTPEHYRKELEVWEGKLSDLTNGQNIDWQLFKQEYNRLVEVAKKIRDIRNYEGNKIKYRPIDYYEMLKNHDPEAIIKGLAALYTARAGEERDCEVPGFKLLTEVAFESPPPTIVYKPPQPWKAWVAYVIKEELVKKLGEVTTKPSARRTDLGYKIINARGGVPSELTNVRVNNVKPTTVEKLPF